MTKSKYCIGVDLGGTNIAVGLVDLESRKILRQTSVKTNAPRPCEAITEDIISVSKKLCKEEEITMDVLRWVGVATPGIVKDDTVIAAFNLDWKDVPFVKILERMTKRPCYIANDANAAAYAEAVWGAGRGSKSLIAFTLGTGVGGGIVFDGRIWEGTNGFAAEMGHMLVQKSGRLCSCGKRGCFEAYCSATALMKETKRMMNLYPDSIMWNDVSGDIERVNGKTPFRAMEKGDSAATLVINEYIDYLTHGVSNIINIFQPDVVCIGGGVSREGEVLLAPLRDRVYHTSFGTGEARTKLVAAEFRNDAGIIGAALLGLQEGLS